MNGLAVHRICLLEIPTKQYSRPTHVASARKVAAIGARAASHAG
jgi:hypothetical protein